MRKPLTDFRPRPAMHLLLASALAGAAYPACSPDRTFGGDGGGAAGASAGADSGDAGAPVVAGKAGEGGAGGGSSLDGPGGIGGSGGDAAGAGAGQGAAGSGGDQSCAVARDCTPPHPLLCGRACLDNVCSFAPAGAAFSTGPDTLDHRTSGFDGAGTPYVFWGDSAALPSSIVLQRLQGDGAPAASTTSYLMPAGTENLLMFDAVFDGDTLGLMWNAQVPATVDIVTQFDVTDVDAQPFAPITLSVSKIATKYPQKAYTQLAWPSGGDWLLAEFYGTFPATWRATWLDPAAPPASPPFVENPSPLDNAPVCSDTGRVAQSAAVVGSTLYLSGFRCDWYQLPDCPVAPILARYDSETLERLDPPVLELTVNPVEYGPGLVRAPVMGGLSGKLAVFWSEFTTPTEFSLGKALFNADGSVAKSRNVEASDLIPKAYVELSGGRALLLSSWMDDSLTPPRFRLQAQLVDDELEWLGPPYFLDEAREEEPSDVRASLSPDGSEVLVTYRQGRARHRLLHASLCQ